MLLSQPLCFDNNPFSWGVYGGTTMAFLKKNCKSVDISTGMNNLARPLRTPRAERRHTPAQPQAHSPSALAPRHRQPRTIVRNSSRTLRYHSSPHHTWNSTWCFLVSFSPLPKTCKVRSRILLSSSQLVNQHRARSLLLKSRTARPRSSQAARSVGASRRAGRFLVRVAIPSLAAGNNFIELVLNDLSCSFLLLGASV